MTNDEKKCCSHKDDETPVTSNMRGAEEEEEEEDGEETSPPPPRRPTRPPHANPREFPRFVPRVGGGDSWRDGATADNLLLRPLGRYLAPAAYARRGRDIDEDQVGFPTRLEGRGIPEAIASRYSTQDALNCERGRALWSSAHSSTRTYQGSSGTDVDSNSTGETGSGVVQSTPLEFDELPAEASAVGGGGSMRPEPVRRRFGLRPVGSDDDDDESSSDDLIGSAPLPYGGRPGPAPVAAPAQAQPRVPDVSNGLRVDPGLVARMSERPTNSAQIVARLRNRRPQFMGQALWDHFVYITNEQREGTVPWETTAEAMARLDHIYNLTMARLRSHGFNNEGQHEREANPVASQYRKKPFPVQKKKEEFEHFPKEQYRLANKGMMEKYGDSRKNLGTGACTKKLAQVMGSGVYWGELMGELEKREADGWVNRRGKGKKGKGKDETTTKTPAKKRKRDEDDDGEEREDAEDDDEEE